MSAGSTSSPAPPFDFEDSLGGRHRVLIPGTDDAAELLWFDRRLTGAPSFEFALRQRVGRLVNLQDASFRPVRGVYRGDGHEAPVLLVSDHIPGPRLSELLSIAERERVVLEAGTVLCLVRQLLAAVAMLHEHAPDVAHGAIAPERIIIAPDGRLVVVEHVLGAALEELRYPPERYWQELGIAVLPSVGGASFSQESDVLQTALVALSLLLGRRLQSDAYPSRVSEELASASIVPAPGTSEPLPPELGAWLARALHVEAGNALTSGLDAWTEFELAVSRSGLPIPGTLQALLTQCRVATAIDQHTAPAAGRRVGVSAVSSEFARLSAGRSEPWPPREDASPEPVPQPSPFCFPAASAPLTAVTASPPDAVVVEPSPSSDVLPVLLEVEPTGVAAFDESASASAPAVSGDRPARPWARRLMVAGVVAFLSISVPAARRHLTSPGQSATVPAGAGLSQSAGWPARGTQRGQLEVRTDPPGARVIVDGLELGMSPMRIDLSAGEHSVVLEGVHESLTQSIVITPAATTSLVVPLRAASTASTYGWLSVAAPVDVQIYERGQLLGSSQSARIMVPAGTHELEIVNEVLAYRTNRTVQVAPGAVARLTIDFPTGTVSLNALPWAEVWVDGKRVGETPIADLALPIGPHEVVFRHPDLGEQRYAISVTLAQPVRLNADLRQP